MALLEKCLYCDTLVTVDYSEDPLCEIHNGKDIAEKERWAKLTILQKLDELKEDINVLKSRR